MVQDLIPDIAATPKGDEGLSLETQDRDVQEFLAQLRRKRMRKRIVWVCVCCLLLFFLGRCLRGAFLRKGRQLFCQVVRSAIDCLRPKSFASAPQP